MRYSASMSKDQDIQVSQIELKLNPTDRSLILKFDI